MLRFRVNSLAGREKQSVLLQWPTLAWIVPLSTLRSAVTPDDTQTSAAPLTLTQALPEARPVPPLVPPLPPEQPTAVTNTMIEDTPIRYLAAIVVAPLKCRGRI